MLALAAAGVAAALAWRVPAILGGLDSHATGDGRDPATYGFDLQGAPDDLVAGGLARDAIRALDHPPVWTAEEARAAEEGGHGSKAWLLPDDRVVGVVLGGEARAYPEDIVEWHEVVDDTVGGVPIAVSYHPLSDAAVVLDRRAADETLEFGHSGLLLDSTQVLYDRGEDGAESLWSPLRREAIAGPAAGTALAVVPSSFVRWEDWHALHPDTTVLARDEALRRRYKRKPYNQYRGNDLLAFPVDPLPPAGGRRNKAPVLVVAAGGERVVVPLDVVFARAGEGGRTTIELGGREIELWTGRAPSVFVQLPPDDPTAWSLHCSWFAWYAQYPQDRVLE